ncbi:MAG: hypothetical protein IIW88_10760, partial [Clostridia bacterium]|nr:hypothetical protein [Clostridia bacterium]
RKQKLQEMKRRKKQQEMIRRFFVPGVIAVAVCIVLVGMGIGKLAKKLAEKYGHSFIDLQAAFDEAVKTVPAAELSGDGVHPTIKGHQLITEKWLEAFRKAEA